VDLESLLVPGKNTLGIEVLSYRLDQIGNTSIARTGRPGLLVLGTVAGIDLSSDAVWACAAVPGKEFRQGLHTLFLGIQEKVDGTLEPSNWLEHDFDDSSWSAPVVEQQEHFSTIARPALAPRTIPQMTREDVSLQSVVASSNPAINWASFIAGESVEIPARTEASVDLEAGELMTAFISVLIEAGQGARLEITAAESYEQEPLDAPWIRRKDDRTDSLRGDFYSDADIYLVAGTGTTSRFEVYSPYWFRTFRYLRLRITTGDQPMRLNGLKLQRTHYPLDITGAFRSSSTRDGKLWEVSVRTALNCMHETFEDCPFYEQLQYAMDTRSQALFSLHLSSDDRLIRRAIDDFAGSGDPNGLTESRAPSIQEQYIPAFSLYWIQMVRDHLFYVGDHDFTKGFIGRIDAVLGYFDAQLNDQGFVTSEENDDRVWHFLDWTDKWREARGVPQLSARRANTVTTFMYVSALRAASAIAQYCQRPGLASEYSSRAARLSAQMSSGPAWDSCSGLFRDTDEGIPQSMHAQVWAVLSETVTGTAAKDLLTRAKTNSQLAACSYAAALDQFDAFQAAGCPELVDWDPWELMLEQNLTTWAEDTVSLRSDCHAWGSVPLQHFPRYVLGVSPVDPGFLTTRINPSPSELAWAEGTVPTPHGPLSVYWKRTEEGDREFRLVVPSHINLVLPETATQPFEYQRQHQRIVTFIL